MSIDSTTRLTEYETYCNGNWCSGPNDGYFYQNLVRLLHDAGRDEELYYLLVGSPQWMRCKSVACKGDVSYLQYLQLAIETISIVSEPAQLLTLMQLRTAHRLVCARAKAYSDDLLVLMTRLGNQEEAL